MTVSKRTRFEVLRRDNYTCRYCRSADNPLRVDHVTPVALGGTDDPANLVAACQDCNAGKASTSLSGEHVADIKADAIRWASAMQRAAEEEAANLPTAPDDLKWFSSAWYEHVWGSPPADWQRSIGTFMAHGMTRELIERSLIKSSRRLKEIDTDDRFRYFCGCCWGTIRDLRTRAEEIVAGDDAP